MEQQAAERQDDSYAFLAIHGTATLRFDASAWQVEEIVGELGRLAAAGGAPDPRAAMREMVRIGFLDGAHLDPARSQPIASAVVYLCMTSGPHDTFPDARGYILEITKKPDGSDNFRFAAAPDRETVEDFTRKARKDLNYVVSITPQQAAKAVSRKRTPPPKDPSLEPPPRPRPDRWLAALEAGERLVGKPALREARDCLENGAMFVWKSRPLADTAQEEIDASLDAMAEHCRLHLPFPKVWAETRDWIDVQPPDAPVTRLPGRFAIAAVEGEGGIHFWGFADFSGRMVMSVLRGTIDRALLSNRRRHFDFHRPPALLATADWEESVHRLVGRTCGERLLELVFLLSTQGVARDRVREGGGKSHGKQKGQRRMPQRDYTVVRVPMVYVPGDGGGKDSGHTGRWVRPHARRAHQWGKYTRPLEEQHWRPACLVNAAKLDDDTEVRRPEYRVG